MKKNTHSSKSRSRPASTGRKPHQTRPDVPGMSSEEFETTVLVATMEPADLPMDQERNIVRFVFEAPEARQVHLAGTFNEWNADSLPMDKQMDGSWMTDLELPSGRFEYRFIVDGQWRDDPRATELVPNAYGSFNAVVDV